MWDGLLLLGDEPDNDPNKNPTTMKLARLTKQAIGTTGNIRQWWVTLTMVRAETEAMHQWGMCCSALVGCWKDECIRKCEAFTLRRWLYVDMEILAAMQATIHPNKNGRGGSGNSAIGGWHTQEINTNWVVGMITGIQQANLCTLEGARRKQKQQILDCIGHGSVICVGAR